jgi:hypothetical protein
MAPTLRTFPEKVCSLEQENIIYLPKVDKQLGKRDLPATKGNILTHYIFLDTRYQ